MRLTFEFFIGLMMLDGDAGKIGGDAD